MASSVRFGNCVVHFSQRTLQRDGATVAVAPLAFDCLAYLIQHRDRAVGRDELVAAVWGKVAVSDAALAKTILTVRRAIGDDGEQQRYLRTMPRFGYRWTAQTQDLDAPGSAERAEAEPVPPAMPVIPAAPPPAAAAPSPMRRLRPVAIATAAILLVLAGLAALLVAGRRTQTPVEASTAAAERPVQVVAVLPADVSGSAEDGWLRLGLMDLVARRLGAAGLPVLPSDTIVRLVPAQTGRDAAIAQLRQATERSRLVALAARRDDARWIVRAELIGTDADIQVEEAQADNAVAAAGQVADRLLERLGAALPRKAADAAGLSRTELLQRIDAARLARQPDQATALIDAAAPPLREDPAVRLRQAQIALEVGRIGDARDQLAALAGQVTVETDPGQHAGIQRSLCIALAQLGRADEALQACDASLRVLERSGTPSELARSYNDRGIVYLIQRRYDPAGRDFASAAIAATLAADPLLLAQIEGNQSSMQSQQGRFAEVAATQQRIGQRFERFGMTDEFVKSLTGQTTAWISLLRPMDALESSSLAMARLSRVTHAGTRLQAQLARANALELSGRYGEQRALLDRVLQEAAVPALATERGIARASLARLELATGTADLALAQRALDDLQLPVATAHRGDAWLTVVRSLLALRRLDEAGMQVQAFSAWAAASGDVSVALRAQLAQAEQAGVDRPHDAEAAYEAALGMAEHWSAPDLMREVVGSYGRFLLARGDSVRAGAVIGQVARYAETDFDSAVLQAWLFRALDQPAAFAEALGHARRLAGDRVLPPALTAPPNTAVGSRSSFGNDTERVPER